MSDNTIAAAPTHAIDPDILDIDDGTEVLVSKASKQPKTDDPPRGFAQGEVLDAETLLPPDEYYIFGYGSLIWKPNFKYVERRIAYLPNYERRCYQSSPDHRGTPVHEGLVVTVLPRGHPDLLHTSYPDVPPILPPHPDSPHITSPFDEHQHDNAYNPYDNRDRCWGVAYRIAREDIAEVVSYLDFREQCGYTCLVETVITLRPDGTGEDSSAITHEDLGRTKSTTSIHSDEVSLSVFTPGQVVPVKAVCWFATTDNPHYTGALEDEYIGHRIAKCHGESGPNYEYVFNLEAALTQFGCTDPHISSVAAIARKYLMDPAFRPFPMVQCSKIHAHRSKAECPSASSSSSSSPSRSDSASPGSRKDEPNEDDGDDDDLDTHIYSSQSNRVRNHSHKGPGEHLTGLSSKQPPIHASSAPQSS